MNLKLKRRDCMARTNFGNGHRFRRSEHHVFDNSVAEVVQLMLKIVYPVRYKRRGDLPERSKTFISRGKWDTIVAEII